jgi:hypothetical protein
LTLASFEKNAMLLCLSGLAAAVSLGVTCVTVMAASQAFANFAF